MAASSPDGDSLVWKTTPKDPFPTILHWVYWSSLVSPVTPSWTFSRITSVAARTDVSRGTSAWQGPHDAGNDGRSPPIRNELNADGRLDDMVARRGLLPLPQMLLYGRLGPAVVRCARDGGETCWCNGGVGRGGRETDPRSM